MSSSVSRLKRVSVTPFLPSNTSVRSVAIPPHDIERLPYLRHTVELVQRIACAAPPVGMLVLQRAGHVLRLGLQPHVFEVDQQALGRALSQDCHAGTVD